MEKEDYQWIILALGILLVIGLIIKPVITHKEPNFGLPPLPKLPPLMVPTPQSMATTPPVTVVTTQPVTAVPAPTPPPTTPPVTTPVPGSTTGLIWNGSQQTVGFVDPGKYNVSLDTFVPRHSEYIPQFSNQSTQTTYRTINYTSIMKSPITGKWSGTTQVIDIPFPYWEIWYTVTPTTSGLSKQGESSGSYVIQSSQGEGVSASGFSGSYSTTIPFFSIDVIDADNPSRFVKTITPPGTLDPELWTNNDPRPWKEKIFEGNKGYYLVITAHYLNSYSVDIKVPTSYIESYLKKI
jgi:hypothetical protein